jgi:hypothetical protein
MARTGRSSAGRSVRRLAASYSQVLLDRELACFDAVDRVFAGPVSAGVRLVRRRWAASDGQAAYDPELRDGLARLGGTVLSGCGPAVYQLAVSAAALGVVSIGMELAVCEAALPARYAGSGREGEAAAMAVSGELADAGLVKFGQAQAAVLVTWRQAAAAQLLTSGREGESAAEAAARLFFPEPVRLPGCSGVGVWWRTAGQLHAAARELAVGVGNRVRTAGMDGFNRAYTARAPLSPPAAGSAVPSSLQAGTGQRV